MGSGLKDQSHGGQVAVPSVKLLCLSLLPAKARPRPLAGGEKVGIVLGGQGGFCTLFRLDGC